MAPITPLCGGTMIVLPRICEKAAAHRVVVGCASLEEDDVADLAAANDAIQIVQRDGVGQSGRKIANFSALEQPGR